MNIAWVLSDSVALGPEVDIDQLKQLGSFWGGWRTWRGCHTDNVICNDLDKAGELLKRNFQAGCNFYIPNANYQILNRPTAVRLYEGAFAHDVDRRDEIVAMHLAAASNDIVLLLGFDFSEPMVNPDKLLEHRTQNYRGLVHQVINDNNQVQWVLVDHPDLVMKSLSSLPNLSTDTLEAALSLIGD
jgi:hypothetical protein